MINKELETRSENKCELCSSKNDISVYLIPPKIEEHFDNQIVICSTCLELINENVSDNVDHWRCLNESMWSESTPVKVMCYRILSGLAEIEWATDLKNMMYLEESHLEWAEHSNSPQVKHIDSNGNILKAGDTVTLIQDLNVKGANFTAKRGTAVRRIRLVHDNSEHIEGKVDGQQIVILTKYVKKT